VYDHVTVATGLRKREVREAVDATLAYLHSVLDEGRDLQLPPLGKIKVVTRGEGEKTRTQYRLNLQKTKSAEGAEPGPEGHQDSLALD
ncbi:MAG: HU family DNA-binding protein, partial [Pseudomonadota bacterium]